MKRKNKLYKSCFFKDTRLPFVEARFAYNSDYHYREHFHDTLSIGAVEEGQVAYVHEKKSYILKPNELAIINPQKVHACNPIDNQSRTYHMMYLDPIWCKGIQESIFGSLKSFISVNKVEIDDKKLYDSYIELNHILLDNKILTMEKEEVLQDFLLNLFSTYCTKEHKSSNEAGATAKYIEKAKVYLKENAKRDICIKEVSEHVGLSEFYFIKTFKKHTNMTPHAFLLNEKICKAKKLIAKGEDISQVAYEVGFCDQGHLNRVFKKYVAATPFEYKRSVYNKE